MPVANAVIRIPLAREGEDTVSLEPSTGIVTFSEDTTSVQVTFRAYQGTTQIYVGNIWPSGEVPGVTVDGKRGSDNLSYVYTFTRTDPSIDIDAQVDFTANISGGTLTESVERTRTLHFISVKPGESAFSVDIDPPYVFFTEGALVVNVAAKVYHGSEVLPYDDAMRSAEWSDVDGVTITRVSQSGGTVNYRFTRTDANADVDGEATLSLTAEPSGTGISVALAQTIKVTSIVGALRLDYNPNMVFGPDDTALSQTLAIYRGDIALTATAVQNSTSLTDKATLRGSVNSDGTVAVTVQRTSTDVDLGEGESHSFQVATSNGEAITVPFMVYSFKNGDDGDPGKDGDPGEDAVYYELDCPVTAITYKAIAGVFAPSSFTATLYKVTGDVRELAEGYWNIYLTNTDGEENWINGGDDWNAFTIYIADHLDYGYPTQFRVHVRVGSTELTKIIAVNSSYAIRGPQRWDDLADSYDFQSGQVGDIYLDVVIHEINGADNYYYCVNTHVKSAGIEPGTQEVTTGNNGYWQQMNKLDSVATSLLLADYAKVANLYVDDLMMIGDRTVIWINPDLDGMKINPVSALNGNTDRASQSAQDAAWNNPLVEFSAADLPDVDTIYGGSASGTMALRNIVFDYNGANLAEENYSGSGWGAVEPDLTRAATDTVTITQGAMVRVTSSNTGTLRLTEGEISGDAARDPEFYKSYVTAEVRISNSNSGAGTYIVLSQATAMCSTNAAGDEVTVTFPSFDTTFSSPFTGTAYLQIYLTGGEVRCDSVGATASVRIAGSFVATINSVTEQYVARYVGQGAFIGLASDTYARFALISGQSRHTLLAAGNGIDISSDGTVQRTVQGASDVHSVPPGGTLLTAWVSLSGGSIQANYWTWDGASISMRRADTGSYAFSIPETWETKLRGDATLNASHFAINVTAIQQGTAGFMASVWNANQGEVQVVLRNADGDLQDGASYLTVHYIGDGQSIG